MNEEKYLIPELGSMEGIDFSELQDVILLAFAKGAYAQPETIRFDSQDTIDVCGVSDYLINRAVEGLIQSELIEDIGGGYIGITSKGLNICEKMKHNYEKFLGNEVSIIIQDNRPDPWIFWIGYPSKNIQEDKSIKIEAIAKFDPVDGGEVVKFTDGEIVAEDGVPLIISENPEPQSSEWDEADWDKADWAGDLTGGAIATELTGAEEFTRVAPASNRIVPLNHNSEAYKEALNALRELSEEATKSNELANLYADPADRVVVLSQITSGIKLLEQKRIIPDVVKRVLEYPIKFIKEKLPDAALGALASKAWDWLVKLFEGLI